MPDAARLIAALCICCVGYVVSVVFMPLMPESTNFGYFIYVNACIGIFVGWTVMGKRAGRGVTAAINNGFGGVLMLVLWCLFIHSSYQMFDRAMANWYNGAFDALLAIFKFMAEYGLVMLNPLVIFSLFAGGLLSGLATEYAWRTWR
ncbi:TrgA family protein [uncultured Roseobacter sp.]|uniref:TrgA family protein n=1 Tax=uncultured Roseobacter sp. TaxID=114847 RepID=UPI0026058BAD|nr:TrgA family protein [uncultured Roseobacter sp.]